MVKADQLTAGESPQHLTDIGRSGIGSAIGGLAVGTKCHALLSNVPVASGIIDTF